MADKMRSVIAHELLHACNVCHHGEKAANPDDDGATMNNLHGLRSGDVACVMRYDNVGTPVDAQCRPVAQKDAVPEAFGNSLCTSATGTGYNTPGSHTERKNGVLVTVVDEKCFGNAAEHRGNCAGQFRVSGKGWNRNDKARLGTPPKACGDRVE